jgi:hypothetical protein
LHSRPARVRDRRLKDFVESISAIDEILRRDPVGVYAHMDFQTRDRYRKVVEELPAAHPNRKLRNGRWCWRVQLARVAPRTAFSSSRPAAARARARLSR